MEAMYRGHEFNYTPPVAPSTDEVLHGQYRGHEFNLRKQQKINVIKSNFKLQYRGH